MADGLNLFAAKEEVDEIKQIAMYRWNGESYATSNLKREIDLGKAEYFHMCHNAANKELCVVTGSLVLFLNSGDLAEKD